ncbi:nuclear pore glycoprotein p62 [Daktulosphaira vitifoliae]|uniref:nuclear pore glycoprotein p62 n=1 Tax=Daktulosphaira vitifoliae TaxID=58002 RepID=UPI0021AAA786|nr:nuclear pore glycoprotein p62 [Daktulosphaira vitifoliae]
MNFNFGTPKTTSQSMFSLGAPINTTSGQPQMGIFGNTDLSKTGTQGAAPGFSLPTTMPTFGSSTSTTSTPILGQPPTSKPPFDFGSVNKPTFSLGATPTFGVTAAATGSSPQFPSNTSAPVKTTASTGFSLSSQTPAASATSGFSLGNTTQASTGFSLGSTTQASTGFSLGSTTQASSGFSLGSTTHASSGFSLGSTTQASSGFTLGTTPASTTTTSAGFTLGSTPQQSTGFSLSSNTNKTGFSLGTSTITSAATTTSTIVSTQSSCNQNTIAQPTNFQQLVDLINNWTVSLENQEKQFLNQANEITVWDNMLTNQSAKLVKLYDILERKEKEQVDIENELDFLLSQQKELEDCLIPLEQELQSAEVLSSMNNEREPIYKAAQEIDNQVKQMSGDIKEIVNNLNKANSKKDSDDDLDTICRILNCHMTALQYIEHNAENLSSMVAEVNEEHSRFLSVTNDNSFVSSFRK